MDAEQVFFLNTLGEHIHGEKTSTPPDINLDKVEEYAQSHQVEAIIYYQTGAPVFRNAYFSQIIFDDHRNSVVAAFLDTIDDISHIIMKGPVIAEYYPVKELRSMGDLDLLVHPEDRDKLNDRLIDFGFVLNEKLTGEWEYEFQNVKVELHTALVYKYSRATSDPILRDYFNNCWAFYKDGKLDFNFHFLYLFMHLRKHIMETGVGFRQFMDIAVITLRGEVDWDWIREESTKLGLFSFIKTVLTFNEKWFNVPSPYGATELDDAFFETATQRIFTDGVFGFENEDNLNNRAINERRKSGSRFSRMGVLLEHFAWPYEEMIKMPEYSWLVGKKFLLPAAWGYRGILKIKSWGKLKNRYFASDKAMSRRYKYLEQWGLRNDQE